MRVPCIRTERDQYETNDLTAGGYILKVRVPCLRTEQDQYEFTDLTASGYIPDCSAMSNKTLNQKFC